MIKSLPRPQPCWKQERNIIKLLRKPVSSNCSPRELVIWRACVSCLGKGKKVWLRFIPLAHPRATDEKERLLKQFGRLSLPHPSDGCLGALRCSRLCRLRSPTQQPKLKGMWMVHSHGLKFTDIHFQIRATEKVSIIAFFLDHWQTKRHLLFSVADYSASDYV